MAKRIKEVLEEFQIVVHVVVNLRLKQYLKMA
jgi:hypothetical protein